MSRLRPEEIWVAQCIEAAMPDVRVVRYDNGSTDSMYDLELQRSGVPFAACEVTAAADPSSIELWNLVNGGGRWIVPALSSGWVLSLSRRCRAKTLKRDAPALLQALEVELFDWDARRELEAIGVSLIHKTTTAYPGAVYLTLERAPELTGGVVAETGDPLVEWFDQWIRTPGQAHNVDKLRHSGMLEAHIFVLAPGFSTIPFPAYDLLIRNDAPLPSLAPHLPDGITHAWFASTSNSGVIFHTDGRGWTTAPKPRPSTGT